MDITSVFDESTLQPGKIRFTVGKDGSISNVSLISSSDYPSIDARMLELLLNIPGEWEVAENSKGEKVDQTLTFFYGKMGC